MKQEKELISLNIVESKRHPLKPLADERYLIRYISLILPDIERNTLYTKPTLRSGITQKEPSSKQNTLSLKLKQNSNSHHSTPLTCTIL